MHDVARDVRAGAAGIDDVYYLLLLLRNDLKEYYVGEVLTGDSGNAHWLSVRLDTLDRILTRVFTAHEELVELAGRLKDAAPAPDAGAVEVDFDDLMEQYEAYGYITLDCGCNVELDGRCPCGNVSPFIHAAMI